MPEIHSASRLADFLSQDTRSAGNGSRGGSEVLMALRRSSTGQQVVHAGLETTAAARFEPHLPRLALFCLRFTQDKEQAAALAERVLRKAGSEIALSRGAEDISGWWLYSILREECRISFRAKSAVATAGPRRRAAEEVF